MSKLRFFWYNQSFLWYKKSICRIIFSCSCSSKQIYHPFVTASFAICTVRCRFVCRSLPRRFPFFLPFITASFGVFFPFVAVGLQFVAGSSVFFFYVRCRFFAELLPRRLKFVAASFAVLSCVVCNSLPFVAASLHKRAANKAEWGGTRNDGLSVLR